MIKFSLSVVIGSIWFCRNLDQAVCLSIFPPEWPHHLRIPVRQSKSRQYDIPRCVSGACQTDHYYIFNESVLRIPPYRSPALPWILLNRPVQAATLDSTSYGACQTDHYYSFYEFVLRIPPYRSPALRWILLNRPVQFDLGFHLLCSEWMSDQDIPSNPAWNIFLRRLQGSKLAVASSKFATWKSHLPPI